MSSLNKVSADPVVEVWCTIKRESGELKERHVIRVAGSSVLSAYAQARLHAIRALTMADVVAVRLDRTS